MPLTLISTPGADDANTYADLTYYKAFIAARRPKLAWAALAIGGTIDDDLIAELISAARLLDAGFNWTGWAANDTQVRVSPRIGWYNRNGKLIDPAIIPDGMKDAQCELATGLHDGDIATDDEAAKSGVKRVKADTVEVEFQAKVDGLDAINANMRQKEARFNYLLMPVKVRLLLVPSWYVEAELAKGFIFEAL